MMLSRFHELTAIMEQTGGKMALATFLASAKAAERHAAATMDTESNWLLLGGCLASLGLFDEAVEAYETVLRINPDTLDALFGLVKINRLPAGGRDHLRRAASDQTRLARQRALINFALGELADKEASYADAYRHFRTANQLSVQETDEQTDKFVGRVERIINHWTRQATADVHGLGDPSSLPVFVVGMPRSGTTLVEQIIASHPQVYGAGERLEINYLDQIMRLIGDDPYRLSADLVRQLAGSHGTLLKNVGKTANRVVDKMPDNVFRLGFISTLFPNARIIVCQRDIRDVSLSCFFQCFGTALAWANDLSKVVQRAQYVDRIIQHWLQTLVTPPLVVQYETLVGDLEGQSRRLVDHLALPWDAKCLDFHQTQRQVITASVWQVRQPLYNRSVERWRHYAPFVDSAFADL